MKLMLAKAGQWREHPTFVFLQSYAPAYSGQKMAKKLWEITDKGLDLAREYNERKNVGGEYREFMKTYSPKLESGKTIEEEEL